MDVDEALTELGLVPGCDRAAVRAAYLARVRIHHPDVARAATAEATARTARLNLAVDVLLGALDRADLDRIDAVPAPTSAPGPPSAHPRAAAPAAILDEGTLAVEAPPPETYVLLYEAASQVGTVAYYDRQLGILEMIVRFEGGPSCSVVMTTQGRATHTEVFCTMESIEADATPSIRPVLDALVDELRAGRPGG
jgi:curved DNA-binding protein CbpA